MKTNLTHRIFFAALLLVSSMTYAVPTPTRLIPLDEIIVFGDSFSDTGNFYEYTHYRFPVSPPYYEGRFSDGPLWVESIARQYFPIDPDAHLKNFAFAGAGVLEEDIPIPGTHLTLNSQLDAYFFHHKKTHPEGLYIVFTGASNYFLTPEPSEEEVNLVVSGISQALARLAVKGARYILVSNLPDLGKTPLARKLKHQENLSDLSIAHNAALMLEFQKLKAAYPATEWIYLDTYALAERIFLTPEQYGIEYTNEACHKPHAHLQNVAYKGCEQYLFFDLVHPTKQVHELVAKEAIATIDMLFD